MGNEVTAFVPFYDEEKTTCSRVCLLSAGRAGRPNTASYWTVTENPNTQK